MKANNILKQEVVNVLNDLANRIEVRTIKIIKADKSVAWGKLWRSIKTKVDPEKLTIDAFADESIAPYAQYVHEGREPGKRPPYAPIRAWVEKKRLPIKEESVKKKKQQAEAKSLSSQKAKRATLTQKQRLQRHYDTTAWKIVRKIEKRGVWPRRFLIRGIIEAMQELPR